jgi:hypothetical protein
MLLGASAAAAQDANPLVGEWEGISRDQENVAMAFKVVYYPDGSYASSLAVPPKPDGSGAGMVYSRGRYQITGDTVQFIGLDSKICAAGVSFCGPYPPGLMPSQFSFRMHGPNEYVAANGTVAHRTP